MFIFNTKTLEKVEEYTYLGVIVSSTKISMGDICKQMWPFISEKTTKAVFFSFKCASAGYLTPKVALRLFYYTFTCFRLCIRIMVQICRNSIYRKSTATFYKVCARCQLTVKDSSCTTAVLGELEDIQFVCHNLLNLSNIG